MTNDAVRVAARSTIRRHRTGAAIYDSDNRLLSTGWSHVPCSTLHDTPWSKHAEHHAIERCRGNPYKITIATLTKAGNLVCAKPCAACMDKIIKAGITEISFT